MRPSPAPPRRLGAWKVKDMNVTIEDGNIKGYRVNLEVTFQLEDPS
jgi:flavin-binding protein dodecin